jgi:hypothetical protein
MEGYTYILRCACVSLFLISTLPLLLQETHIGLNALSVNNTAFSQQNDSTPSLVAGLVFKQIYCTGITEYVEYDL